jgi:hypothetical protein
VDVDHLVSSGSDKNEQGSRTRARHMCWLMLTNIAQRATITDVGHRKENPNATRR